MDKTVNSAHDRRDYDVKIERGYVTLEVGDVIVHVHVPSFMKMLAELGLARNWTEGFALLVELINFAYKATKTYHNNTEKAIEYMLKLFCGVAVPYHPTRKYYMVMQCMNMLRNCIRIVRLDQ